MGWMEVLALLKRIAPLLNKLAPMLETFVATRAGSRGDPDALERLSGDIRGQVATAGEQHTSMVDAMQRQANQMDSLTRQVASLQQDGQTAEVQLRALAQSLATLQRVALALAVLLVLCAGLLLRLVLHKPA